MTAPGIIVYKHIPLDRLAMSREEVETFVAALNAASEGRYHEALITNDDTLAIDARLARRHNL